MKVVFRADASVEIGTGHVMRCLTLADALRQRGHHVQFACVPLVGNVIDLIQEKGYHCYLLARTQAAIPSEGDWLVVDHYQLAAEWEASMRTKFRHIMVIDDLASRQHDCDILLDQNRIEDGEKAYWQLVPTKTLKLFGPQYALLRSEFTECKRVQQGRLNSRVFVSFGGSDPSEETIKLVNEIVRTDCTGIHFNIIVGNANPNYDDILNVAQKKKKNIKIHKNVDNMAELMCRADIGIGSGGSTTWERLCLGLPSLIVIVADNQRQIAEAVAKCGAAIVLGDSQQVTGEMMWKTLVQYLDSPGTLEKITVAGKKLVDGRGCERVVQALDKYQGSEV